MSNFRRMLDDVYLDADDGILDGVNRYNPKNLKTLEPLLDAQIAENEYHTEANLTILKLYQLNPTEFNVDMVAKILLKSLMALPKSDFVLAKSLLELPKKTETNDVIVLHRDPKLHDVLLLGDMIEACEFESVWDYLSKNPAIIQGVLGFEDAVRRFICHTVDITFQTLSKKQLVSLLGNVNDQKLAALVKEFNWKLESDGTVTVHNHEDTVKSRNIEEKLDFSHIQEILRAA